MPILAALQALTPGRTQSPGFFNDIVSSPTFSMDKASEVKYIVDALEVGSHDAREEVAALAAAHLAPWCSNHETVEEYWFHFDLNHFLKGVFNKDRAEPNAATVHVLWDHEDRQRQL